MRWCNCPRSEAAALAHGGSWTNEDCPHHGREAQDEMNADQYATEETK